jgi:hypothetical protein
MNILSIDDGKNAATRKKEGSGKNRSFQQNAYILSVRTARRKVLDSGPPISGQV